MGEDDIMELIWKRDQIVSSSPTQRPTSVPPILRGSGSGGDVGEGENAPVPPPPPPPEHHQNLFIHEDEMAAWLHHQDDFFSHLLYSGVAASQPQSFISLAPPPPPTSQVLAARRAEYFTNFARLRGNILTGAGPLIPVSRESTQVDSSATSSVTESCQTPATAIGGVSQTFAVPGLSRKAKEVAIKTVYEVAGTSSSAVCKAETEPIQIQPAIETDEDRKRKEREEPEETEEAGGSRKRSRAAEMHNSAERRRRGKINERMKALQELIPRCKKSDKASMLEDAIEYVKSLQLQIQMMSTGGGAMPMMYTPDMQRSMLSQMAMGMMDMNRPPLIPFHGTLPFPRQVHMAGLCPPNPFPASNPSRTHIPTSQQPDLVSNQPQFPDYLNPYYTQFAGFQQMQQPPPLQNLTTSQPSFGQASSSREPEDQENQPTDPSKSQFEDN